MSPHRSQKAHPKPGPSLVSTPTNITSTRTTMPKSPPQQTLWNFIHSKVQSLRNPPDPTPPQPLELSTQPPTQTHLSNPESTPHDHLEAQPHPSSQLQPVLNPTCENNPWGDSARAMMQHVHFRVVSKNISTLNTYSLDMTAIATELKTMVASVFLAQETNTAWTPTTMQVLETQCHAIYKHKKIATSSSKEKCNHRYQPGGTLTLVLDDWAS